MTITGNSAAATTHCSYSYPLPGLSLPPLRAPPTRYLPVQAEYEQGKKAHTSGMGADPSANPGLRAWFGVLRHLNLPLDADAAASELAAFVDDSEAKVTAALAAVTRYYEAAKATTDSLRALRDALADWTTGCTSAASALSETLAPVRSSLSVLGVRLKKGCDAFSNVYDLSVFAPNEVQVRRLPSSGRVAVSLPRSYTYGFWRRGSALDAVCIAACLPHCGGRGMTS